MYERDFFEVCVHGEKKVIFYKRNPVDSGENCFYKN